MVRSSVAVVLTIVSAGVVLSIAPGLLSFDATRTVDQSLGVADSKTTRRFIAEHDVESGASRSDSRFGKMKTPETAEGLYQADGTIKESTEIFDGRSPIRDTDDQKLQTDDSNCEQYEKQERKRQTSANTSRTDRRVHDGCQGDSPNCTLPVAHNTTTLGIGSSYADADADRRRDIKKERITGTERAVAAAISAKSAPNLFDPVGEFGKPGATLVNASTLNNNGDQGRGEFAKSKFPTESVSRGSAGSARPISGKELRNLDVPEEIDWRLWSAVTPVVHQGKHNSCWAIAAAGQIEGLYAVNRGQLIRFSAQEIIDCCWWEWRSEGGGRPSSAFAYMMNFGLSSDAQYPYKGERGTCEQIDIGEKPLAKIRAMRKINGEEELREAIGLLGPVAVGLHCNFEDFRSYRGGIYRERTSRSEKFRHAALAVGYGSDEGVPFWLIRNSHGTSWGEEGYVRMIRGENICQISSHAFAVYI